MSKQDEQSESTVQDAPSDGDRSARRSPRDDAGDILTSREARELLKVGRTKLWELTRANAIPAYRVGHGKTSRLRYRRSELFEWLEHMRI